MFERILNTDRLENIIQTNWADILDYQSLKTGFLKLISDSSFAQSKQEEKIVKHTKISVTKSKIVFDGIELWFEYELPKDNGVVIGTIVCELKLSGVLEILEVYGTHMVP